MGFPDISAPLAVFAMAFAPDGSGVVTTRTKGPTLLWDPRLTVVRRYAIGAQAVAVSPDGDVAALIENGDDDYGHRFVLEPADRRSANRVGRASGASKTAYEAVGATFTPDGRSVVTVGNDSRLLVWDVATAHVRTTLAQTGDIPLRGPVLSPDGTTAYATDRNRDVVVWDLSGNHRLDRPFTAGTGWPGWPWFAMSTDGRLLAVPSHAGFGHGGMVALIETTDLRVVRRILYTDSIPQSLAFSPDSTMLAVASLIERSGRSHLRLWDTASGRMTAILHHPRPAPGPFEVQPGRQHVGERRGPVHRGLVWVWMPETPNKPVHRFRARGTVEDLTFTPDGSQLVVSTGWGDGGYFVLWDTAARRILETVPADDAGVLAADISTDGRTLVTGGQTSIVRLWDLPTRTQVGAPLTVSPGTPTPTCRPTGAPSSAPTPRQRALGRRDPIHHRRPVPRSNRRPVRRRRVHARRPQRRGHLRHGPGMGVERRSVALARTSVHGRRRSFTRHEWQEFVPDRPYHATCGT